jgi:hypothetical protein
MRALLRDLRGVISWRLATAAVALLALASPYAHAMAEGAHHGEAQCELCTIVATGAVPAPAAAVPAVCARVITRVTPLRVSPPAPAPSGPAVPRSPPAL